MGWPDVIQRFAASELTARRVTAQLRACEAAALAFCRLLERWNRGDAVPATAGARQAALRHAADRVETAIAGLEEPLSRYLLELEPDRAEGRSWYAGPGAGELEGLTDAARMQTGPDRASLWAGLFDLRDTLLGSTVDDLRAIAA
jgi:hypothetical protein